MNAIELEVVEGTAFMAFGELEYAQHNKRLLEAVKSKPDMLPVMLETWLNEWVRMAEEMIDQCAAMYVLGSKGEAIFDHEDLLSQEKSVFINRIQKVRQDTVSDVAEEFTRRIKGK